ncbi:MAG: agmatinase [Ignavibacteria bacterium]|jgi:agmatinase
MKAPFPTLRKKDNFLGLEKKYSGFEESGITILPCPYEKTTSYGKGTKLGPQAILASSHFVEFFDEETKKEVCFEHGIAVIKPLNFSKLKPKTSLDLAHDIAKKLLTKNKFVVTLGGEHTISLAPLKAHADFYKDLSILQFDAHSDLRIEYEGSRFSHASFAARAAEITSKITQIGIRAQCKEEFEFIKEKGIHTFYAYNIKEKGLINIINDIIYTLDKNVYITFDVDYFDPSIMPSTGTPEPGGFYWDETLCLLKEVIGHRNLVGFDVVELSPRKSFPFPDFLIAKLVYKILNYKF